MSSAKCVNESRLIISVPELRNSGVADSRFLESKAVPSPGSSCLNSGVSASNDAAERDFWDDYMEAYEEMIQETATKDAPWYVVPADNKWFTRVIVGAAVIETLADLDLEYPEVGEDKLKELATAKKKLLSK